MGGGEGVRMGGTRWGSPRSSPLLIVRDLRKLTIPDSRSDCPPAQPSTVAGVVREASRLVRGHSASPLGESKGRKRRKADLMKEILTWPSPPGCQSKKGCHPVSMGMSMGMSMGTSRPFLLSPHP